MRRITSSGNIVLMRSLLRKQARLKATQKVS
jgi:hypothetical protein